MNQADITKQMTEFFIERRPWAGNRYALYCIQRTHAGGTRSNAIALPLTFLLQAPEIAPSAPFAEFDDDVMQQLMDELWRVGIRPTTGHGSAGQLLATQQHLEDMRQLVMADKFRKLL